MKKYSKNTGSVEINATEGVFVIENGQARLATTLGDRFSRSGLTNRPAMVEEGFVVGYRADSIPKVVKSEYLIVFPVGQTGFQDNKLDVIKTDEWDNLLGSWYEWRARAAFGESAPEERSLFSRLARNHTRSMRNNDGVSFWTRQEVVDAMQHNECVAYCSEEDGHDLLVDMTRHAVVVASNGLEPLDEPGYRVYREGDHRLEQRDGLVFSGFSLIEGRIIAHGTAEWANGRQFFVDVTETMGDVWAGVPYPIMTAEWRHARALVEKYYDENPVQLRVPPTMEEMVHTDVEDDEY